MCPQPCHQFQLYGPPPEEKSHGTVSLSTYYHYFRTGGGFGLLATVITVFLLGEVFSAGFTSLIYSDCHTCHYPQITVVVFDWWLSDW